MLCMSDVNFGGFDRFVVRIQLLSTCVEIYLLTFDIWHLKVTYSTKISRDIEVGFARQRVCRDTKDFTWEWMQNTDLWGEVLRDTRCQRIILHRQHHWNLCEEWRGMILDFQSHPVYQSGLGLSTSTCNQHPHYQGDGEGWICLIFGDYFALFWVMIAIDCHLHHWHSWCNNSGGGGGGKHGQIGLRLRRIGGQLLEIWNSFQLLKIILNFKFFELRSRLIIAVNLKQPKSTFASRIVH